MTAGRRIGKILSGAARTAKRSALPGREVMSMVTYSELFAYSLVLIGVATLVLQFCKRK